MSPIEGKRVAIANRGEIAVRIAATCTRMGAIPVLLLGEPDLQGYAARQVGRVELVGPAGSEMDVERVIEAAKRARAEFLHPGYGFLSERPALAEAIARAGITFVGPSAATLRLCGDKLATRDVAQAAGVPILAASPPLDSDPEHWLAEAEQVGFPLMVKPAEAGGGRGLRHVADVSTLIEAVRASRREGVSSGSGEVIFLEREILEPRHVEVQVVADGLHTFALGDRDCSFQRRHQKVIEEAPAPHVSERTRQSLHEHACRVTDAVGLRGIATCEFLIEQGEEFTFLEVNPRIQVEHPVTELVTGVDLVSWQLLIAAGTEVPIHETPEPHGHAIEARVYAEDPAAGFIPTAGALGTVAWPRGPEIRVDAGYGSGDTIPSAYDALLAKVIGHCASRADVLAALQRALHETVVSGVATNVSWLLDLIESPAIRDGRATTRTAGEIGVSERDHRPAAVAGVAYKLEQTASEEADPWSVIGPWRSLGQSAIHVHGEDWQEQLNVWRDSAGWQVQIGDDMRSVRWWRDPSGIWTIATGDNVLKLAVREIQDAIEVCGEGGRWIVRMGPRPLQRGDRELQKGDGQVLAPLPTTVVRIHVSIGDRVAPGDPLVTLNAMKMEIACESPAAGTVESITCREAELVAADQLLVKLIVDSSP